MKEMAERLEDEGWPDAMGVAMPLRHLLRCGRGHRGRLQLPQRLLVRY